MSADSVLLIGSTGMGKSTLGNYLLDPDENHMYRNQTFARARDNRPTTQQVQVASRCVQVDGRSKELTIIDTPGLNESSEEDVHRMQQIVNYMNSHGKIRACIFVVKFNAKIDIQYKDTIEYYCKLLPGFFEKNVFIVMTEFETNSRSKMMRMRDQIDVEQIKSNTISEICKYSKIKPEPELFLIDCLPLESDEMETSLNARTTILKCIFQFKPTEVKNQIVAKTNYIKRIEAEKYAMLMGEITGFKERLQRSQFYHKEAITKIHRKEMEIFESETMINNLEEKLQHKNTTEEVVAGRWSINEEWKAFQWFTRDFNISLPFQITDYTTWTNGRCEFKEVVQTPHAIKGKVEGEFMRGIYASVTAYTQKRIKYASEIEKLNERIEREKANLARCKAENEIFQKEEEEIAEDINSLRHYIKEKRDEIVRSKIKLDHMNFDEVGSILQSLHLF